MDCTTDHPSYGFDMVLLAVLALLMELWSYSSGSNTSMDVL